MKALAVQFGQTRFVYNFFLRKRIDFYSEHKGKKKQGLSYYDTANMLTELKKQAETTWLQESSAQVLQQSLRHLDVAYNNFFNKHKAFPKFKKKRSKQTFTVPQRFRLELSSDFKKMGQLIIPKITPLKIIIHRQIF